MWITGYAYLFHSEIQLSLGIDVDSVLALRERYNFSMFCVFLKLKFNHKMMQMFKKEVQRNKYISEVFSKNFNLSKIAVWFCII